MSGGRQDGPRRPGFATRAVHAGQRRTAEGEQSEPIFATASFAFASAEEAAARFAGERPGNIYSRFTNPTVQVLEERLASLEGGEGAVAFGSGMAAILAVGMALLGQGDHVVASQGLFGSTVLLLERILGRFGVRTSFVPLTDPEAWRAALRPETRLLFLETPSNPLLEVADLPALARLAREAGALLVVDNTLCTAALQRPLALGADLVVLSTTKYVDGQGRAVGGAVVGGGEPLEAVRGFLRTAGPCLSPFHAWLHLKGLETLALRMRAHSEHALALARWLEGRPEVLRVHHPGLPSHPQHALAMAQQGGLGGGIVSFELAGGREAAWRLIDAVRLFSVTANLGDAKSTITHPASTTHARLSPEERAAAGITEGLVRIAVGLEDPEDLRADLAAALERLQG
ncbi:MAG: O-succinylhomoserine sulfhydrylase [Gammaproteobacteria bacterium]|nr:MAG: O-succinylhomoserine sulfhydrylase [Gammaproteobacteria bacterium]